MIYTYQLFRNKPAEKPIFSALPKGSIMTIGVTLAIACFLSVLAIGLPYIGYLVHSTGGRIATIVAWVISLGFWVAFMAQVTVYWSYDEYIPFYLIVGGSILLNGGYNYWNIFDGLE